MCVKHSTFLFSAVAGDDFLPNAALSITFPASSTPDDMNACASIDIVNDDNIECEHSFTVEVGDIMCDVDPPIASASPLATVTIFDEDGMLRFKLKSIPNALSVSFLLQVNAHIYVNVFLCLSYPLYHFQTSLFQ